jgi:tetratricopeptide (TPR) repeat protein
MESYKTAVKMDPDHFLAQFNLGIRYGKVLMNLEAAECFRQSLRVKPDAPMVHYSLAVVSNLIGETDEAFKHYEEAIRINPEFARAHSNLAMMHYSVKRGREAIHHLARAAEQFEKTGDEFMLNNARDLIQECSKEFNLTEEECRNFLSR